MTIDPITTTPRLDPSLGRVIVLPEGASGNRADFVLVDDPAPPGRLRRFLRILFKRRFSLVDLLTWLPAGGAVTKSQGLFAGLVTVAILAACIGWIEGKVNGDEGGK